MSVLGGLDHLGNIDAGPEQAKVLHDALRVVFGKSNSEFREHAHVLMWVSYLSF